MSTTPNSSGTGLVTHVMRAAIKIGDDYFTVEHTVALPPGAPSDILNAAMRTGTQIYEQQRVILEEELGRLRAQYGTSNTLSEDNELVSDKQRGYIEHLLTQLNWDYHQLQCFALDHNVHLLALTKHRASTLIDRLKDVLNGTPIPNTPSGFQSRQPAVDGYHKPIAPQSPQQAVSAHPDNLTRSERADTDMATQRQVRALERLVDERNIDAEQELLARFKRRSFSELSMDEAGQLLSEWQRPSMRMATPRSHDA